MSAFNVPKTPSAALALVTGPGAISMPEAVKQLWKYIKLHDRQNPKNKRNILADAVLRPIFGKDEITMFEVGGILGKHLS